MRENTVSSLADNRSTTDPQLPTQVQAEAEGQQLYKKHLLTCSYAHIILPPAMPYLTDMQPTCNSASEEGLSFLTNLLSHLYESPRLPKFSHRLNPWDCISFLSLFTIPGKIWIVWTHALLPNWEQLQSDVHTLFPCPHWLASPVSKHGLWSLLVEFLSWSSLPNIGSQSPHLWNKTQGAFSKSVQIINQSMDKIYTNPSGID